MWNERYSSSEYAYGTTPNDFLVEYKDSLPKGRILSLAEGEGRNAVFLAKQGYDVTAVDSSIVGLEKAQKLAKKNGVYIECVHADLAEFQYGEGCWDAIISIFCPLPSELRKAIYGKVEIGLRVGGVFLTESYTPNQPKYGTGGGDCIDTMQSKESLIQEFPNLQFNHLVEVERDVIEGIYHTGLASVVQAVGHKKI
jgi:SAM-dependent methyltransferase